MTMLLRRCGAAAQVLLALVAFALAFAATVDRASALTRDAQLPDKPKNIADLFIADTYQVQGAPVVDWFCRPNAASGSKICSSDSKQAFSNLIGQMAYFPNEGEPRLLRAGKARDDCTQNDSLANCGTGVPATTSCPAYNSTPYCALVTLKDAGINPGVVVGARDTAGGGRSTKDIAWQACQIHIDDATTYWGVDGLYDFMFLDQADFLGNRLKDTVQYISQGKVWTGSEWAKEPACGQGWDVITNDNNWRSPDHPMDTMAWGHAKHYEVAETFGSLANAADSNGPAVTNEDKAFIARVNNLTLPEGLTTGPVLRVEVTEQTDILSRLSGSRQCAILRRWAAAQTDPAARFASLFPLYNAGFDFSDKPDTDPYNSYAEGTGLRQLDLMGAPNGPASVGCPS